MVILLPFSIIQSSLFLFYFLYCFEWHKMYTEFTVFFLITVYLCVKVKKSDIFLMCFLWWSEEVRGPLFFWSQFSRIKRFVKELFFTLLLIYMLKAKCPALRGTG